jgi:hypothetical protein
MGIIITNKKFNYESKLHITKIKARFIEQITSDKIIQLILNILPIKLPFLL